MCCRSHLEHVFRHIPSNISYDILIVTYEHPENTYLKEFYERQTRAEHVRFQIESNKDFTQNTLWTHKIMPYALNGSEEYEWILAFRLDMQFLQNVITNITDKNMCYHGFRIGCHFGTPYSCKTAKNINVYPIQFTGFLNGFIHIICLRFHHMNGMMNSPN